MDVIQITWEDYKNIDDYGKNIYFIKDVPVEELYTTTNIIYDGVQEKEYNFDIVILDDKAYSVVNFLFRYEDLDNLTKGVEEVNCIIIHDSLIKKKLYNIISRETSLDFFYKTLKLK